jgi:hypothetical protein
VGVVDAFIPPSPDSEVELRKFPAVEVMVNMELRVPEVRRFAGETIARWLRDNATREGVDYVIVFNAADELKVRERAAGKASGDKPSLSKVGGGREPARGGSRDEPLVRIEGSPTQAPGSGRLPRAPGRQTGDTPKVVGEGGGGRTITETTSLDSMAPLAPATSPEASTTGDAVLRFTVYLKPYVKPAPADASPVEGATPATKTGGGS